MKRLALAVVAALIATAAVDALMWNIVAGHSAGNDLVARIMVFGGVLLGIAPGFVTLSAVLVLLTRPSKSRMAVAATLLLARLFLFDFVFVAPKRADLNQDIRASQISGQPIPVGFVEQLSGVISEADTAAGTGCVLGAITGFLIARRRKAIPA